MANKVGDVVNGRRWDGSVWVRVAKAPASSGGERAKSQAREKARAEGKGPFSDSILVRPGHKKSGATVPYAGGLDPVAAVGKPKVKGASDSLAAKGSKRSPVSARSSMTTAQKVMTNLTPPKEAQRSPTPPLARAGRVIDVRARPGDAPAPVKVADTPAVTVVGPSPYTPPPSAPVDQPRPAATLDTPSDPRRTGAGGDSPNAFFSTKNDGPFDKLHRKVDGALFGGTGGSKATYKYPTGDNRSDKD